MKNLIYVFVLTLLFANVAFAKLSVAEIDKKLSNIEVSLYGFDFKGESTQSRLKRLETDTYGVLSQTSDEKRVLRLEKDLDVKQSTVASSKNKTEGTNKEEYYPKADATAQYPIVDELEKKVFKSATPNEDIYKRISKLEKSVFKKENQGSLNSRVELLKDALLPNFIVESDDVESETFSYVPQSSDNYYSPNSVEKTSIYKSISVLESKILQSTYPQKPVDERLTQLENKVFSRSFSDDDELSRIQRIAAAFDAQKTSSKFSGSKWERGLATGMQVATFLFMILAMIL